MWTNARDEAVTYRRRRSKTLLGNADRIDVGYAVARSSGIVHAQELSDQLGISPPRVRAQLLAFTEAGAMRLLPRDGNRQNYERIDSDPFWRAVTTLVEEGGG